MILVFFQIFGTLTHALPMGLYFFAFPFLPAFFVCALL